jgi:hypothetical protein
MGIITQLFPAKNPTDDRTNDRCPGLTCCTFEDVDYGIARAWCLLLEQLQAD